MMPFPQQQAGPMGPPPMQAHPGMGVGGGEGGESALLMALLPELMERVGAIQPGLLPDEGGQGPTMPGMGMGGQDAGALLSMLLGGGGMGGGMGGLPMPPANQRMMAAPPMGGMGGGAPAY